MRINLEDDIYIFHIYYRIKEGIEGDNHGNNSGRLKENRSDSGLWQQLDSQRLRVDNNDNTRG